MSDHLSDISRHGRPQYSGALAAYDLTNHQATQNSPAAAEDLTCPACLGRGWVHFPSSWCSWCSGSGRIKRPDLPTPEEQIDYTEMLEREDDIADDLARADEAAWREENFDD